MSTRTRWIVRGVVVVLVLGLAVLFALNTAGMLGEEVDGPDRFVDSDEPGRWWELEPGETITVSADQVNFNDRYRCPGHPTIYFTPQPGTEYTEDGGLLVETAEDGTVTATCEAGQPGDY